jgi:heat shock protein HslJ
MSRDSAIQGSWVVTAYRSGDVMIEPDQRVEASLMIDGTLIAGSMGVNRFHGRIDDDLPMGPLGTTLMAGPEELMRQEDTLLEHLQSADAIEVDGEGMFLRLDGLLLVELERTGTDATV